MAASGEDLRSLPLLQRKRRLRRVIPRGNVQCTGCATLDHIEADGCGLYRRAWERDLEGIVAKHRAGPYDNRRRLWVKRRAIDRANRRHAEDVLLNHQNMIFANISPIKGVWRIDVPLQKIAGNGVMEINLLLYDQRSGELHHLRVSTEYLQANESRLLIDRKKGCASLELSASEPNLFQDIRPTAGGVEFKQFKDECS